MAARVCMHYFITGKVQGVWFRANTKKQADQLGIKGWARNLPDGRVEVLACGNKAEMDQLHEWLKQGPPLAKVTDFFYEESEWPDCDNFETF